MPSIFSLSKFEFPYRYKFPGQNTDEVILFVTRENVSMLRLRQAGAVATGLAMLVVGWGLGSAVNGFGMVEVGSLLQMLAAIFSIVTIGLGYWWVTALWKKSVVLLTSKRFVKFIYTTPFNRHNLSLPLEMIVDTGAYNKGFFQAMLKLGTFTARSAAAGTGYAGDDEQSKGGSMRVNKKYFYIENIAAAEDLQHYVSKLLEAHRHYKQHLPVFRPFIPHLKGDARAEYMKQYPEYWS
jgi:hypothetical protein